MYFRTGGRDERERYQYNYRTVQRYLSLKRQKKEIKDFFEKNKFKKIALYGNGELGKCMINDIMNSEIEISYIIDQAFESYPKGYEGVPVINIEDVKKQEEVDVIVITVLYELNNIIDLLTEQEIPLEKIINISDVVYSL